jgi:hypothetical protein
LKDKDNIKNALKNNFVEKLKMNTYKNKNFLLNLKCTRYPEKSIKKKSKLAKKNNGKGYLKPK